MDIEQASYDVRSGRFDELAARTAYALWRLRSEVFVVEQDCPYLDLDGRDLEAGTVHVWAAEADTDAVLGCLRVLDDGEQARIGRVLVTPAHRGRGIADALVRAALTVIGARASVLDAQSHLAGWYARFGYARSGPDFVEDGILHTPMQRPAPPAGPSPS